MVERELGFSVFARGNTGATPTERGPGVLVVVRGAWLRQMDNLGGATGAISPRVFASPCRRNFIFTFIGACVFGRDVAAGGCGSLRLDAERDANVADASKDVANCESDMGVMYLSRSNEGAVGGLLERHKLEFFELFEAVPHVFGTLRTSAAVVQSVSLEDCCRIRSCRLSRVVRVGSVFREPLWAPSAKTVKVRTIGSPLVLCCILMHIPSPAGFTRILAERRYLAVPHSLR